MSRTDILSPRINRTVSVSVWAMGYDMGGQMLMAFNMVRKYFKVLGVNNFFLVGLKNEVIISWKERLWGYGKS